MWCLLGGERFFFFDALFCNGAKKTAGFMKKILVIDNYDSFVYNLVQMLRTASVRVGFDIVRNDEVDFSCLENYGGILLSPGPGVPSEAGDLLQVVRACRSTHSILGVCLGFQAIAVAFGACLCQLPNPLHGHLSRLCLTGADDPLLRGVRAPVCVGRYHSWVVDKRGLPEVFCVSSVDEDGNIMSMFHRQLRIYGVQFHPESYISNCGRDIVENWLATV